MLEHAVRAFNLRAAPCDNALRGLLTGQTANVIESAAIIAELTTLIDIEQLLARFSAQGMRVFRFSKVYPSEISTELLEALGFRLTGAHRLYAARARSA